MKSNYTEILAAPKAQTVPVARAALTAALLACGTLELKQVIDEFVLSNPLVAPAFDGLGSALPSNAVRAAPDSLSEHLARQLRIAVQDPALLNAGLMIVHSLDRNGYLREDERVIRSLCRCSHSVFERALDQVQHLEPVGVGARSLSECLCLQLEARELVDELALLICRSHLEDLAENRLALPDCTQAEIDRAVALIRSLTPYPGSSFDCEMVPFLVPDILIEQQGGQLEVSLVNQPQLPALNTEYIALSRGCTEQDRQYIREHLAQARSFLFAMRQRSSTLFVVSAFAVQYQAEHLMRAAPLRPLTLTNAAKALSVSISVVSRTVKEKYVQYGGHIFPLRALFTSGGTKTASRHQIIQQIYDICSTYGGTISDQAVADLLASRGISIARRTVNKYRKIMLEEGDWAL